MNLKITKRVISILCVAVMSASSMGASVGAVEYDLSFLSKEGRLEAIVKRHDRLRQCAESISKKMTNLQENLSGLKNIISSYNGPKGDISKKIDDICGLIKKADELCLIDIYVAESVSDQIEQFVDNYKTVYREVSEEHRITDSLTNYLNDTYSKMTEVLNYMKLDDRQSSIYNEKLTKGSVKELVNLLRDRLNSDVKKIASEHIKPESVFDEKFGKIYDMTEKAVQLTEEFADYFSDDDIEKICNTMISAFDSCRLPYRWKKSENDKGEKRLNELFLPIMERNFNKVLTALLDMSYNKRDGAIKDAVDKGKLTEAKQYKQTSEDMFLFKRTNKYNGDIEKKPISLKIGNVSYGVHWYAEDEKLCLFKGNEPIMWLDSASDIYKDLTENNYFEAVKVIKNQS